MKSSSKALIWVLLVFLVGAGFGAATTFLIIRARLVNAFLAGPAQPGEERQRRGEGFILRQMLRQLDLDAQQEAQVRQILERTRTQYQQAERERIQTMRQHRRQTLAEIRQVLNPEQQEKLDNFLKRIQRRRGRARD